MNAEKHYSYAEINGYEYVGIDSDNTDYILTQQPVELEATEQTYEQIKPILENCQTMKDLDSIIETGISKKYTVGKEFKMRDLPVDNPERVEYENYKASVKAPIHDLKIERGLRLAE